MPGLVEAGGRRWDGKTVGRLLTKTMTLHLVGWLSHVFVWIWWALGPDWVRLC